MENLQPIQEALYWFYGDFIRSFSFYLPKIIAGLLVFIFGTALARMLRKFAVGVLETFKLSKLVKDTPVDHFLQKAEIKKVEVVLGKVVYWLAMLVVLHSTVAVLGLEPLTGILEKLLSYIPKVFSAVIVLFVGIILAGLIETVVKATVKNIHAKSGRLLGKVSSYLVMSIGVLVAISELGIASDYILILFVGFIMAVSLGSALALGLGAKDIVSKMLSDWYEGIQD
ncbi:MAG: hypothetical protein ABFQ62_02540 [Patescibacteria group bacterium]